jgi:hypothetical protein
MEKEQHLDLDDLDLDLDLIAATLTAGMLTPTAGLDSAEVRKRAAHQAVELYAEVLRALEKKFPQD